MFCPKCGTEFEDSGNFCPSCGFSVQDKKTQLENSNNKSNDDTSSEAKNYNESQIIQDNNLKNSTPKNKNKKTIIILLCCMGALLIVGIILCVFLFVVPNNSDGQNYNFFNIGNNNSNSISLREQKYNEIINEYEQAFAWYNAQTVRHKDYYTYSTSTKNSILKDYLESMEKSYPDFASFNDVATKYAFYNYDNDDEYDELLVKDNKEEIVVYKFNEEENSATLIYPDSAITKNLKTQLNNDGVEWIAFKEADMHVKLAGIVKVTTAKERAMDPWAKCSEFDCEGGYKNRESILSSQYIDNSKYAIFQLDEEVVYPIQQLNNIFPHKINTFCLTGEKNSTNQVRKYISSWESYNNQHLILDIDILKCNAPSGMTGLGYDVSYETDSSCVVDE